MKKLEFNMMTNAQHKKVENANPEKEPSVLFSPLKYNFSEKNLYTLVCSPEIKIKENNIGPAN
jgi:hypothetical protein